MFRGYRIQILAAFGLALLALSGFLTWGLYPEQPEISGEIGYQENREAYYPGGRDCQPTEINRLIGGKRTERAIACDEKAENHRLQSNDLIQQRRAAQAAEASAISAYYQARIAAWGLLLGGITMGAAIAAAFYARSAAVHTETAAKMFLEAERAHLLVQSGHVAVVTGGEHVIFRFHNPGRAAARVTGVYAPPLGGRDGKLNIAMRAVVIGPDKTGDVIGFPVPTDKAKIYTFACRAIYTTIGVSEYKAYFAATLRWEDGGDYAPPGWEVDVSDTSGHPWND